MLRCHSKKECHLQFYLKKFEVFERREATVDVSQRGNTSVLSATVCSPLSLFTVFSQHGGETHCFFQCYQFFQLISNIRSGS